MSNYEVIMAMFDDTKRSYYAGHSGNKMLRDRMNALSSAIELIESLEADDGSKDGNGNITLIGNVSEAFWINLTSNQLDGAWPYCEWCKSYHSPAPEDAESLKCKKPRDNPDNPPHWAAVALEEGRKMVVATEMRRTCADPFFGLE